MEGEPFYSGEGFQIHGNSNPDPIIWDDPAITALSEALIHASPPERHYFFTKAFRGRSGFIFPDYFLHPADTFNPDGKTKSSLFNVIEIYREDNQGLKEFIGRLIEQGVLIQDSLSIFKCNRCDGITLGESLYCNGCGRQMQPNARRRMYALPHILQELFFQPGKIVEGVVLHSIKTLATANIKIAMNGLLKAGEASKAYEVDVAIKNETNGKIAVIHITTNPRQEREVTQFGRTLGLGIGTVFVTTAPSGTSDILNTVNEANGNRGIILWDIGNDTDLSQMLRSAIEPMIL